MAISSLRQRLRLGFLSGQSRRPIPRKPRLEQLEDRTVLSGGRSGFFQAATVLFAAVNPHSVAVGDFNGDGKPDLAVAGSGTINVLLGNGDGTFQPSASIASGSAYTGFNTLAVGDFGNGHLDLAVANRLSGQVNVLLGNGDGTFQAAVPYAVGANPDFVAVADLVNGRPDLLVVNAGSMTVMGSVSVLLGNGNGTFQPAVSYNVGRGPNSLAVGDFGNGHPDLAVANTENSTLSVLLGNGDGTLHAGATYGVHDVGTNPFYVAAADFAGNGKLDLVVTNQGSNSSFVRVLRGNGNGTFQTGVPYAVGANPTALAVGDFGNGKLDLAVANQNSDNVSVLFGNGDGTFHAAANYAIGSGPTAIAVGDFNGDGKPDLAVASSGGDSVTLLLGNGHGTFMAATNYAAGTNPTAVAVADVNGDGQPDLVVANQGSNNVSILQGNGDGTFQAAVNHDVGAGPTSIALGNFNGNLSLAVANKTSGTVSVLLGDGHGNFQPHVDYPVGINPVFVAVADVNGDGSPDLVVVNQGSNTISVLLGNGDGTFQSARNYAVGTNPTSVAIGDFNGDGKLDLAVTNTVDIDNDNDDNVRVLLGNGDGTFQAATSYAGGESPSAIAVGDFNGDGKLDLAVTNKTSNKVSVLLGNGNGTFQAPVSYAVGASPDSVLVGDFNGDGKLDLAVTNQGSGTVSVLFGNGDGSFQPAMHYATGVFASSVAAGDFEGDGKPDLVVANQRSGTVSVLLNQAETAVNLTTSSAASVYGQAVTFTAVIDVLTPGAGLPTGTVQFQVNGINFGAPVAVVANSIVASASLTTSSLPAGSYTIQAIYSGDATFLGSSDTLSAQEVVDPAPLTITADNQTMVYGGPLPTLTVSFSGFVNGDTAANLTTQPTLSTTATVSSHVSGNPYSISVSGAVDSNYTISYVTGNLTVTPAPLTITADSQSMLYGGIQPTLTATFTGLVNGDTPDTFNQSPNTAPVLSTVPATSHEGTYVITVSGASDADYAITFVSGSLTIAPATLVITADNQTMVYGGSLPTLTASYSGLVNGDTPATFSVSPNLPPVLSTVAANSHAGSYVITVSGAMDSDYAISFVPGTLTITPAPLTITADNQGMIYGGTPPTLTATFTGLVNGDTPDTFNSSPNTAPTLATVPANSHAGSYAITVSGASDSDYAITFASGTLTITPAPLTITADSQSMIYGGTLPTLTATFTGLVNGDTPDTFNHSPNTAPVLSTVPATSHEGTYAITVSGASDGDYAITFANGSLTIAPASLTITADSQSIVYGSNLPNLTATFTGLVNGDTPDTFNQSPNTPPMLALSPVSNNVGSYTITVSGASDSDYAITFVSGTLTITPASLTLTVDNQSMVYGSAVPVLTGTLTGLVNGDAITASYSTTATSASDVVAGGYPITATLNDPNGRLSNYTVTNTPGTLTITPAEQTITWANPADIVYGTALDSTQLNATVSVVGPAPAGALTYTPVAGTVLNAGARQTLTVNVAGTQDYNPATATVTLNVAPAPLTVTVDNKSMVYGSAVPVLTGTLTGLVNGDVITASYSTPATSTSDVVTGGYAITATLNDPNGRLSNYTVTNTPGTLTITPAEQTITWANPADIVYGTALGSTQLNATVSVVGPAPAGALSSTPAAGTVLNAGAGQTLTVNVAGTQDYNPATATVTLNVTPAPLSVTVDNKSMVYGSAVPVLTGTLTGLVNGDAITASYSTTATSSSDVVTGGYPITATLNDPNGRLSNYTVTNTPGTLTITRANQTITWANPADIVYGTALTSTQLNATVSVVGPAAAGALTYTPAAGTVLQAGNGQTLSLSVAGTQDYNPASATVHQNVTPAPLTITADNKSMIYGGTLPSLTATYTGLVNGDTPATFTVSPNIGPVLSTVSAHSHAGTYAITVSGASDANYSISYQSGTLTVAPAPLTITADNKSMVYGGALPPLTASFSGLVNGDTPATFSTSPNIAPALSTALSTSPVGSYPITVSGAADADYSITFVPGRLTITPAPLTITANNQSMVFGAPLPPLTASFQGFVNGDTSASLTKPATLSTTATPGSPVGDYPITASGAIDPNYTISFIPGTLTVTQANTSTTVSSSVSNPAFNQLVTFTAVVSAIAPGSGAPTGTVEFQVNGTNFGSPVSLATSNGVTSAALSTADLPIGRLAITAQYNGDHNFIGSLGTTSVISGTDNQRWVNQVYLDLLNRPVEPFGLGVWTGALSQGSTRTQVVEAVEASPEYLTDVVKGYYRTYLHRDADSVGLSRWVAFLQAGATKEQVQAGITGSAEYFQNRGGGTVSGFLDALYQDGLGRAMDASGQSTFTSAMAKGATPAAVAAVIFSSDEYRQDLVRADFQEFLHRPADDFGFNSFLSALRAGATDQAVAAAIIGSGEYFGRV